MTFAATSVSNELADGHARESVILGEGARLTRTEHVPCVRGELDAQGHRLLSRKNGEVDGSLRTSRTPKHPTRDRAHRCDMAWAHEIHRARGRVGQHAQCERSVLGGYSTARNAARIDGHGGRRRATVDGERHGGQIKPIEKLCGDSRLLAS